MTSNPSLVRPDACIIPTMGLMCDIRDSLLIRAKNGFNAVTANEEAFFPFNSSPDLMREVDELAGKPGCTVCGSGYQDVFRGIIATLADALHWIRIIRGRSSDNVEDDGIALARAPGAGLDPATFERKQGRPV